MNERKEKNIRDDPQEITPWQEFQNPRPLSVSVLLYEIHMSFFAQSCQLLHKNPTFFAIRHMINEFHTACMTNLATMPRQYTDSCSEETADLKSWFHDHRVLVCRELDKLRQQYAENRYPSKECFQFLDTIKEFSDSLADIEIPETPFVLV